MSCRMPSWFIIAAGIVLATVMAGTAAAQEKYALVVGVARYASPAIRPLDGPAFDAEAVQNALITDWGFSPARVRRLVNEQATKQNILAGLDWLVTQSKPGDIVMVFYSGHGTSRQDRNQLSYALHPATGAIFPYDVATDSEARALETLIIGRRDLRPRLDRLDAGRQVLVVIDSCYSRNATRSLSQPRGTSKGAPLFGPLEGFTNTAAVEPYPYSNIVSLTAASEGEEAIDIGNDAIRQGVETIDGRPKGSLTDALLRALRGDANRTGAATLTLGDMFQFVRSSVASRFSHTPQLMLPAGRTDLLRQPLLGMRGVPLRTSMPAASTLRVRVDGLPAALTERIDLMDDIAVAPAGPYDVRVADAGNRLRIYHESGDLLVEFPRGDESALLARLQRERYARRLVQAAPAFQDFNVRVDVPSKTGVLQTGQQYTITCESDVPVAMLVLDIDKEGNVSVLSPQTPGELALKRVWSFPVKVLPPEGTEFVKVLAFRQAPSWLNAWIGADSVPADSSRVRELLNSVENLGRDVAEARVKVVTVR